MKDPFKAYNEHVEKIREEYPILHQYGDLWAMELYRQIKEGLLTEFLKTVDPEVTMKQVQKRVGNLAYQVRNEGRGSKTIRVGFEPDDEERIEKVIEIMEKFGWYPAFYFADFGEKFNLSTVFKWFSKGRNVVITFEATHDAEKDAPPYMYHITSGKYMESIDKKGLIPRMHGKLAHHPGRVYLLGPYRKGDYSIDEDVLEGFASSLYYAMKPEVKQLTGVMVVYRIDTSKVKKLELYDDPNFEVVGARGYYTYNNIPPSAMSKVKIFDTGLF